jgi:hypothetical protein
LTAHIPKLFFLISRERNDGALCRRPISTIRISAAVAGGRRAVALKSRSCEQKFRTKKLKVNFLLYRQVTKLVWQTRSSRYALHAEAFKKAQILKTVAVY